jgi:uncharacterized protein
MSDVLTLGVAGFVASFVDGALGMGFGVTSSSVLLAAGVPASTSAATVNIVKIASGGAAALSHWRLGNIDRAVVRRLVWSGALGAVIGAIVLRTIDASTVRPVLAGLLLLLGARLLARQLQSARQPRGADLRPTTIGAQRRIAATGLAGGITNGVVGAWGPVVTPSLLQAGLTPRRSVGSSNTAECAVAVVALGSLLGIADSAVAVGPLAAMLIGSVIAAPLAAWSIRWIPARSLGIAIGCMLIVTNARELAHFAQTRGLSLGIAYACIATAAAAMLTFVRSRTSAVHPEHVAKGIADFAERGVRA